MPALDFPNSPATNDTFAASGKTWRYTGVGWALIGVSTAISLNSYNLDGGKASTNYGGVTNISGGSATG